MRSSPWSTWVIRSASKATALALLIWPSGWTISVDPDLLMAKVIAVRNQGMSMSIARIDSHHTPNARPRAWVAPWPQYPRPGPAIPSSHPSWPDGIAGGAETWFGFRYSLLHSSLEPVAQSGYIVF